MKSNIHANLPIKQMIDYAVLLVAFFFTRRYIAAKGDVFFSDLNLLVLCISICSWTLTGLSVQLYEDFRTRSFSFEFVSILKTVLLHTCILTFLFFYVFKFYPYPRTFTLLYSGLLFVFMTTVRFFVKQLLLRLRAHGHNIRNILIVGAGETGMGFHRTIANNDHFGYRCVGFVDDQAQSHLNGQYLGKLSDLHRILEEHEIDDVVVALPGGYAEQTEKVIVASEREAKRVRIIADCYRFCTPTVSMNLFGTFPILTIRTSPLDDETKQRFKRTFDICFSALLFVTVFIWLFPIIALAIKLSSPGPVFFVQPRWGLKNRKIRCYKFRSMRQTSGDVDGNGQYMQATRHDPRTTAVGRFLRRTNLDELPQFINVLLGDMSVVGPRPHPIPLHVESKDTIQHYMLRHLVKPGITGWAQVNGCRGETRQSGQMQKRVNLDLWYIENYSFWLDCQILFQTVMNMIKGDRNAY
ncbi:undecaprenyl-phosphate glucose phosphotransferase [Chitinophaga pendula]|uniref:undecaprenyl-phosphate glucose phosphotransferase n=1 Tax=Chitinophaga TaxID=79328 RepID=UPI000BAF3208|nr:MULTISPECIES: undecaprenyl-phosphate glucose phosphotransferase [Chitinophaga]ASZ14203.1 undecaprenyl-phosphate glucose phosphotransferase [Chitinophaga sp. MD30]UCJ08160.1 undecaprenyl-phosphate glucose phosphotransferase [Chitinophaga pendula]